MGTAFQSFFIDDKFIVLVGSLILVDIVTGIAKATKSHNVRSAIFRNGGYKKFLIVLIIVLCWSIDKVYFSSDVLYTASCTYYLANEMVSIIENLSELGVPVPQKVKDIFFNLSDKDDE